MRIITIPSDTETLRTRSAPVKILDRATIEFLKDLGTTLKDLRKPAGVGLSAIQVGKPIRAFATLLPEEEDEGASFRAKSKNLQSETVAARFASLALASRQSESGRAESRQVVKPSRPSDSEGSGDGERANSSTSKKSKLLFYINPEIIEHSRDMTLGENLVEQNDSSDLHPSSLGLRPFLEGCLSIPHLYGPVKRWKWINARATVLSESDLVCVFPFNLQPSTFNLLSLSARVFQHELDHLNGILFTDRTLAEGNQLYKETNKEFIPVDI